MRQLLWRLWHDRQGQDLIEYTLLMFFVVILTIAIMASTGDSIKGVVSTTNSQIVTASQFAGS